MSEDFSEGFMSEEMETAAYEQEQAEGGEWVTGVTGEDVWVPYDDTAPAPDSGELPSLEGIFDDADGDGTADIFQTDDQGGGQTPGESGGGGFFEEVSEILDDLDLGGGETGETEWLTEEPEPFNEADPSTWDA